ncbi:MAG: hypothetical protein AAF901_03555 [Bacteroidota bacterium]
MKYSSLLYFLCFMSFCFGQNDKKISTVETVQVLNNNKAEAIYYFQNNWKVLRDMAVAKGYIHSYSLIETTYTEEAPFHMMLMTTYIDEAQYEQRETRFRELIEAKGALELLNEKTPNEFRKSVFSVDPGRHLN